MHHRQPLTPLDLALRPAVLAEFSPEEYAETKADTLLQLGDFQSFLSAALKGDLTLVDEFGAASLAIQAAVSSAFHTPEVIRLFAQKQPDQLRTRLETLKRDYRVKKLGRAEYVRAAVEVLTALQRMGSELSEEEAELVRQNGESRQQGQLEDVSREGADTVDVARQQSLLSQAKSQITQAHK